MTSTLTPPRRAALDRLARGLAMFPTDGPTALAARARVREALFRLGYVRRGRRGPELTAKGRRALAELRARDWTPEEDAAVREGYAERRPAAAIAARLPGRSVRAVESRASRLGVRRPIAPRTHLTVRQLRSIQLARKWGTDWGALAERFGTTAKALQTASGRAGEA